MKRKGIATFVYITMLGFLLIMPLLTYQHLCRYPQKGPQSEEELDALCDEMFARVLEAEGTPWIDARDPNNPTGPYNSSNSSSTSTPAHVHNYTSTVTKEATCSEEGIMTYTCSGCGNSYTEPIPMTDHKWVETVVTPATCSNEGTVKKVCSVCGKEVIEKIPINPEVHDYEEVIVSKPTCTEDGKAKKVCKDCGAETDEYVIPAIGHNYTSKITTEPTCTEAGVNTFTCSNCGDTYTEEIPALGHEETAAYVYKAKIGSLVFGGKTVYTCNRCGAVREEADPNSLPFMLLIGVGALIAMIVFAVVIIVAVRKNKGNSH